MKIIDEQGKLFGVINLIDFLVIVLLLSLIPGFYAGYKIITMKPVEVITLPPITTPPPTHYTIPMRCSICHKDISDEIQIPLGERPKRYYKIICPICKNQVRMRKLSEY